MFYLQVLPQPTPSSQADTTSGRDVQSVPSTRGLIYDATGNPLVKNVVDYSVTVTPSDLPLDQEPIVAQRLGSVLNLDPVDIETQIDSTTGSLYVPVKIADGIQRTSPGSSRRTAIRCPASRSWSPRSAST